MDLKILLLQVLLVLIKQVDQVAAVQVEKVVNLLMKEEQVIHLLLVQLKVKMVEMVLDEQQLRQVNLDLVVEVVQVKQQVINHNKEMTEVLRVMDNIFQVLFLDQQHQVTDNHQVL